MFCLFSSVLFFFFVKSIAFFYSHFQYKTRLRKGEFKFSPLSPLLGTSQQLILVAMSSSSTSRFLPFVLTKRSVISSKLRKIFNSTKLALYSLSSSQEQTHDLEWRKSAVGKVEATRKFEDKEYKCR